MNFNNKPIFGMIHLSGDRSTVLNRALEEIEILEQEGVDGIIVENYHGDVKDMEKVLGTLNADGSHKIKVGLNVLPNEFALAFSMANEYGAEFIQLDYVSGVYSGFGQQKFISQNLYDEFREKYKNIKVLGGVWPKYYQPVNDSILENDIKIGMERAEAIVVTGEGTGKQTPLDKIKEFRSLMGKHPLIVGAGLKPETVSEQLSIADGAIVGSCFKPHGVTTQKIERSLVKEFMDEVKNFRI